MRKLMIFGCLAAGACSGRRERPASAAAAHASIEAELVGVLDRWYAAMERNDSAGTAEPLTDRFLLLEDTVPMTKPQLVAEIGNAKPGARPWHSERSGWRTRREGGVAWTTFANHETQPANGQEPACAADFLETVVFVEQNGRWLIDRYHAAAVNRWRC